VRTLPMGRCGTAFATLPCGAGVPLVCARLQSSCWFKQRMLYGGAPARGLHGSLPCARALRSVPVPPRGRPIVAVSPASRLQGPAQPGFFHIGIGRPLAKACAAALEGALWDGPRPPRLEVAAHVPEGKPALGTLPRPKERL
jgi:hypothetical protein